MALWNSIKYERRQVLNSFGDGINTSVPPFDVKDTEATYLRNIGSQEYPSLSVRYGRTFYSTTLGNISTPLSIGERNNSYLHIVDGNTWKYWDISSSSITNLTTSLSSTEASIQDFATGTNRYTILMNSTQKKIWDGTSTALDFGDANTPFTKIFTVHKGRVYAARDNDIMFSALNLPNDWTTVDDSGSIDVTRAKGVITGICEYNDHVIVFTEYGMHELYGDGPSNFTLIDVEGSVGCISNKSIVKCNKKLYWLWLDGIYEYNGASPVKVSLPVDDYIKKISYENRTKAVSGAIGDNLYISIPYDSSSNNLILVYDTLIGKWYIENQPSNFIDFVTIQNKLYGLDSTGGIYNMRSTTYSDNGASITWEYITKPYTEGGVSQQKTLKDMSLIFNCSTNSTLNVSYSTHPTDNNSTSFTTIASTTDLDISGIDQNIKLLIPTTALQNANWYRLRFSGQASGQCTIHFLEKNYRIKRR